MPIGLIPVPMALIGAGNILSQIFLSLGIDREKDCDCSAIISRMNNWGPDECEQRIDWICKQIHNNWKKWRVGKKGRTLLHILQNAKDIDFPVDPLHPIKSCVEEAIRLSRAAITEAEAKPP